MNEIIIGKELSYTKWNKDTKSYDKHLVDDVLKCLRVNCSIEPGTTLKDIFNVMDKYPELKGLIQKYSWCHDLPAFQEQMRLTPKAIDDVKYLEVYHEIHYDTYDGVAELSYGPAFHGVGDQLYSVSVSPMNELGHLEVRLNEKFQVDETLRKPLRNNTLLSSVKKFCLLDVLDAIYWDISFYGGPSRNEAFLNELSNLDLDSLDVTGF